MRPIKHGATDQSVVVRIVDSADGTPETGVVAATAGLSLSYRREGEAVVALTALNDLALLSTAHTDGGILHIGNGYYRVDPQDAAWASGATGVMIFGGATGMVVIAAYHPLVAVDFADAVRFGLTALPNAAADAPFGLPISDAGGLDLDAQKADVAAILVDTGTTLDARIPAALVGGRMDANVGAISADATAADNAEAFFDGTGYAGTNNVIPLVTTATNLTNAPTNGDLTATMKTSVTTAATAATPTAAAVTGAVGSVTGNVGGSVVGSVASVVGAVGSVTGNVGGNVTGSVGALGAQAKLDVNAEVDTAISDAALATAANLATVAGYVDTEVAAIKAVTDKLDTALELDVAVYRFTTNALEQAPSGGGGGTDWTADEKTAIKTILGVPATGTTPDEPSAGALKVIDDFLDTEVAAIKAKTDNLPASPAATGDIPSAAAIRAEMDTNSTKLSDILTDTAVIGAAGAGLINIPWNIAGGWSDYVQAKAADALASYDPPTKAELDSAVAPLATAAGVSAVETDTQDIQSRLPAALTGAGNIKADAQVVSDKTGYALTTAPLDAAGTRTAIGLASANLDTQISAVAASATTAATQSTAAASSASTAATQATNAAADALQTKKVMEAMPILDTSTTPWSLKLIQQGTGTSGANYLDGTVLRTLYLYTAAGVAVTAATQVVGSQRDS